MASSRTFSPELSARARFSGISVSIPVFRYVAPLLTLKCLGLRSHFGGAYLVGIAFATRSLTSGSCAAREAAMDPVRRLANTIRMFTRHDSLFENRD